MRYNSSGAENVKRLRRIILIAVTVLSLKVCAVTVASWFRTVGPKAQFEFRHRGWLWGASFHDGRVWIDNEPQRQLERAEWEQRCNHARASYARALEAEYWARQQAVT